jgi:hypothetical protein
MFLELYLVEMTSKRWCKWILLRNASSLEVMTSHRRMQNSIPLPSKKINSDRFIHPSVACEELWSTTCSFWLIFYIPKTGPTLHRRKRLLLIKRYCFN